MPSLPNPIKIATKSAEIGFQIGTYVAGRAFQRVQSLVGGDSQNGGSTYTPVEPQPPAPKLEAVETPGTTSSGSKPTTSATTATGPGGTNRTPPKARAKPAAKKNVKATSRTGARSAGGRISNPKAAAKVRKRNAGGDAA